MKWCGLLNCKGEYCFLEEEFNVDYLRSREEIVPKCGHSCPSHTHTHARTHARTHTPPILGSLYCTPNHVYSENFSGEFATYAVVCCTTTIRMSFNINRYFHLSLSPTKIKKMQRTNAENNNFGIPS